MDLTDLDGIARRSYDAYSERRGGKNKDGQPNPNWEALPAEIRDGWKAAQMPLLRQIREGVAQILGEMTEGLGAVQASFEAMEAEMAKPPPASKLPKVVRRPRVICLDTEFMESGRSDRVRLLSIALVAEDGAEFYAETTEDRSLANDWVREHVLPQLKGPIQTYGEIAAGVREFVDRQTQDGSEVRFWGYFADYDWVLFCQIFGRMVDLPKGFPFYCWDLKQTASELGIDKKIFPEQKAGLHHALADAKWNLDLYRMLKLAAPHGLDI